jgi:CRISPR-associated protein Cmr2
MDWFAKAYALLHDPPHKALWFEGYRIYSKTSHEEEARQMLATMLMATPLGGGAPPTRDALARRVDLADRVAASFDRWALPKSDGGYWVKAKALYNPFNVKYSLEITRPDPKAFEAALLEYVHDVNNILREASSERDAYMLLYATAELAWVLRDLPALPADTRAPTHTIFDHLYATASVMNWVGEGGRLRGCLLEVDIPGIQKIISSARKAGDYNAGSLLVSLAIWLTAWQYMRAYGPDVLLSPTPRFNPLFYLQLEKEIKGGNEALELYSRFVAEILGFRELPETGRGGWAGSLMDFLVIRASVMPGTAYLMLPDCGEAEKAPDYFDKALTAIKDAVLGSEDVDPPLPIPLGVDKNSSIYKLTVETLRQMPMPYLPFRYRYVSVEEAREEARRLAELLSRGGPPGVFDEERLLFYAARRLLHRRPAIPRVPSWFAKGGAPRFKKLYDGPWIHSTLDPDQPASLRFGQSPDSLDYDEATKKMLEELLGRGWDPKELKRVFRPKEALGPVDVLKRALYYAATGGRLPSVQEVALWWYAQRESWIDGCPEDVRNAVEKIVEGEDAEEVIGPSPAPDQALRLCKPPGEKAPPMSFMYAIISADGDFIGQLNRGCVRGLGPDVEKAIDEILPKDADGDAEQWRRDREAVDTSPQGGSGAEGRGMRRCGAGFRRRGLRHPVAVVLRRALGLPDGDRPQGRQDRPQTRRRGGLRRRRRPAGLRRQASRAGDSEGDSGGIPRRGGIPQAEELRPAGARRLRQKLLGQTGPLHHGLHGCRGLGGARGRGEGQRGREGEGRPRGVHLHRAHGHRQDAQRRLSYEGSGGPPRGKSLQKPPLRHGERVC